MKKMIKSLIYNNFKFFVFFIIIIFFIAILLYLKISLKNTLGLDNSKLLNLMKSKLIKGYSGEDNGLILNMNLPDNMKNEQSNKNNDKITDL